MRYINKANYQLRGNQIIDSVLEISWIDEQNQYVNANYDDGLCNNHQTFYIDLINILLENQQNFCCYCMKLIEPEETTLEHIIPHNTRTQDEFDRYLDFAELMDNVIYSRRFDKRIKLIPPEKYPHDIAYYNLVASCNSNAHCNHYRSSKFIRPLFYDNEIENKVIYDSEGIANCADYDLELISIGISTNQDLKAYRKVWKKLAETKDSLEEIDDDEIDNVVFELVNHPYFEILMNNLTGDNNDKVKFKKYNWFFQYYKQQPNHAN